MSDKTCAHAACTCKAAEGSDFCCDGCQKAHDNNQATCGCDCGNCG